jgi:hypothetical protein
MASTWMMVKSGYRELTGLIYMFFDTHPIMLAIWPVLWWVFIYFMSPTFKKLKIETHVETIAIYYAIMSFLAGIGNFYLFIKFGVQSI